jgi:hypothetical protein
MNVARIRTLAQNETIEGLDKLEESLMAKMDDDTNDLEALGGELTDILSAKQILIRVRDEGIPLAVGLRDFMKSVRGIIN